MSLEAVNEIEEDCELFANPEHMALCNDFIPDNHESSNQNDSDDEEKDDFWKDEVVYFFENKIIIKEEDDSDQEEPMLPTQHMLTSSRGRSNTENSHSSKPKQIKSSMINSIVEHNKVKTDVLNKTKHELRKLTFKFKSMNSYMSDDHSASN